MSDVGIIWKDIGGDIQLNGYDLAADDGLTTAVIISLFTDRRAEDDDPLPAGADRRGWWADAFPEMPNDKIGSRLWLLYREKQTQSVVNRAREYAEEALQWLIDDGIAKAVIVTAEIVRSGVLGLSIQITKPDDSQAGFNFQKLWEAH